MESACYVSYFSDKSKSFYLFLTFLQVDSIEDSFSIIKSRPKPLAAYLFTNNEQLKKDYVDKISSGGMLINDAVVHVVTLFLKFIVHESLLNSNILLFYKYDPIFINLFMYRPPDTSPICSVSAT